MLITMLIDLSKCFLANRDNGLCTRVTSYKAANAKDCCKLWILPGFMQACDDQIVKATGINLGGEKSPKSQLALSRLTTCSRLVTIKAGKRCEGFLISARLRTSFAGLSVWATRCGRE